MVGYVYIMTNRKDGVLYTGVTADLIRRVYEHKEGVVEGFTKRYHLKTLVYFERHDDIEAALQREKNIKHYVRQWKIDLIQQQNPLWHDLYPEIL
ncbi:MAG: GIY-YIG nuclease family protein [Rickettsiales bacterium]|nr:GIY-YIG nuclease family protein [Rickettsiales bacterium]